jgi:hypothetical protein
MECPIIRSFIIFVPHLTLLGCSNQGGSACIGGKRNTCTALIGKA